MASEHAIQIAAALCRKFEGLYRGPYICPAGVPTIGYGATFYEDGRRVKLTDPIISEARAEALLLWHLDKVFLPSVKTLCPGALAYPALLGVLADFTFNLGAGQLKASTLRRKVNSRDFDAVPFELRKWVIGGGKRLRGLVLRRGAEITVLLNNR